MENIEKLLEIIIQREASDLHIVADVPPCIRVHGELEFLNELGIVTKDDCRSLAFELLSKEQQELLEANLEIDLSFEIAQKARFRINIYNQKSSLAISVRLIPLKIKKIDDLSLPKIFHEFAALKQGFVLVTGPTGHGKSTSLAAIIDEINETRSCNIVAIEDPIEFVFESKKSLVSQRELHQDTHSWPIALRSVLREDPDVVLIGEMRDYDTISAALTIAETGHLVFSTLHTNSAAQTVDRIVDAFPEDAKNQVRIQLSTCLEAVFSQRLVPLISGGRTVAYEVMIASAAIRTTIRDSKTHMIDNVIQTSGGLGMISMESTLAKLVTEGKISLETARLYALRPEEVLKFLKK